MINFYGRQEINQDDINAITETLRSDFLTTGSKVVEFEKHLSEFVRTPTIVLSSGTAALHAAYFAVGLKDGDEIITPPNTFIATQAAAANLGARISFADIDISTGLISVEKVKEKISTNTRAIVLVDYAGQACDIDAFKEITLNTPIKIIQDAAHSLGTLYKNKPVGGLADITTFSFYPTKNITTGEGGAIATSHLDYLKKARRFSRQGLVREEEDFLLTKEGNWHQEVHEFGLNYRLTDIQCALGISQLSRISVFKEKRKRIFDRYKKNLGNESQITLLKEVPYSDTMWHLFPIFVDKRVRSLVFKELRAREIGVQVNYFPAHMHPVFRKTHLEDKDLSNATLFYQTEISLPMHTGLSLSDIDFICEELVDIVKRYS